jgi:hypothetical protein
VVAAVTASCTASDTSAPEARASAAVAANRSPAPHVSPSSRDAAGTTSGVGPAWQRIAPPAPTVTAIAPARHRCRSICPARWAVVSAEPPPASPLSLRTSASFGVTSRTPGTGAGPSGCGSQTTGAFARSIAARSSGRRATPRP